MQDLMGEMKRNDSIQKLSFNDSDLNDIHGIFILEMIKCMAQRRDQGQWTQGLRQSYHSGKSSPSKKRKSTSRSLQKSNRVNS